MSMSSTRLRDGFCYPREADYQRGLVAVAAFVRSVQENSLAGLTGRGGLSGSTGSVQGPYLMMLAFEIPACLNMLDPRSLQTEAQKKTQRPAGFSEFPFLFQWVEIGFLLFWMSRFEEGEVTPFEGLVIFPVRFPDTPIYHDDPCCIYPPWSFSQILTQFSFSDYLIHRTSTTSSSR